MFIEKNQLKADLAIFLSITSVLIIIGLLFIYSSSSVYALERLGSAHYFVKRQSVGLALGLVGLFIARLVPLEFFKRFSPYFFLSSLVLTGLTLIPALSHSIHGSRRWLALGAFSFQPSELLKISLLLYLAYFFSKNEGGPGPSYRSFLLIVALPALILLRQPDFGMAVTLSATAFMLFFILCFNLRYLIFTIATTIPLCLFLIYRYPYRIKRIITYLNPWNDPHGSGFQIIQSLIAIGSGSFWGIGVSHSKQKFFYLPMLHTDFIFSIIAEETGFVGATLLISLYLLFLYFGLRIAWQVTDPFSAYLTLGFVLLISLQTITNLGVTTGLLPTKGIGLPFVSYGNSSLICSLFMIGLIMNCVDTQR